MLPCKDKEKVPLAVLALFYGPCIDSQLCKCNSLKQITLTFNAVRHGRAKEKKAHYNEMLKDIWNKHFNKWQIYIFTFLKQSNQVNKAVGSLLIHFLLFITIHRWSLLLNLMKDCEYISKTTTYLQNEISPLKIM